MKKSERWLMVLLTITALGIFHGIAGAGALVIKDDICTFLDQDGKTFFNVTADQENLDLNSIKVITPSKNCNKNVSCHAGLADGSLWGAPGRSIVFDYDSTGYDTGVLCLVKFQCVDENGEPSACWFATPNWHETITSKGNISLTCHFKDCDAEPCSVQPCPDGTCGPL